MSKIRVLTFGTFDYFHAGHQHYLDQAAAFGSELFVIIARDDTVKQVKGFYPDQNQKKRKSQVQAYQAVTKAIIGNKGDKYTVLKKYQPQIICLGYDQQAFTQQLQKKLIELGLNTKIERISPFKPEIYKSSIIKESINSD